MLGLRKVFGSHGNLSSVGKSEDSKFSDLVGGGTMVQRGAARRKIDQLKQNRQQNEFKIGERENGNRTLRNLEGLSRDSEVLYVGTFANSNGEQRGKISDVFSGYSNDR